MVMIEKHPFGSFVPKNSRYLLLGSFAAKNAEGYTWFYGTKRNQFWPILEEVYGISLKSVNDQKRLLNKLKLAVTDVILECERKENNNLDTNLKNLVLNHDTIRNILYNNKIQKIFFSSRFVENIYRRKFNNLISQYPNIKLITLPSPSPRYVAMSKVEKITKYKKLLPKTI